MERGGFNIGLAMAGAASAGAYTAGVLGGNPSSQPWPVISENILDVLTPFWTGRDDASNFPFRPAVTAIATTNPMLKGVTTFSSYGEIAHRLVASRPRRRHLTGDD